MDTAADVEEAVFGTRRCLAISRQVCMCMVASAAETFPNECMGGICSTGSGSIDLAIPYQIAKRKVQEVNSDSSTMFDKLFKTGQFHKIGDFHSHTFQWFEKMLPLEPSTIDLADMRVGEAELIIQTKRTRRNRNSWKHSDGRISIAWGRYRFVLAAFERLPGKSPQGEPWFRQVNLKLA